MKDPLSAIFEPRRVETRETEMPRCTRHEKPIREVVRIHGALDDEPHDVNEAFRPLIVHVEENGYTVCSAGSPRE